MEQEVCKLSVDLKTTLSDIASLSNHKNSKVALSARQVKGHQMFAIALFFAFLVMIDLLVWICYLASN